MNVRSEMNADLPSPFSDFAGAGSQSPLRAAITVATRRPEPQCVAALIDAARLPEREAAAAHELASTLASRLRARRVGVGREGLVQGLMQEFSLSSQEGVALMCLAEALLRIPDTATRDALIRDKIGDADWESHVGRSRSLFVNAATWGLLLTGKLVSTHTERGLASALTRIVARSGEPLIRRGVDMAMRLMGEQFVTGETIGAALAHARRREAEGFTYSYDMLGEAAMTAEDAQRYFVAYEEAIHAIGQAAAGRGLFEGPGISLKLSALHPRYSRAQRARVMAELYPRLLHLTQLARRYDIGLNIDAEEADRLEISLDLLERLCHEPQLAGWNGIGFVVQAYMKRAPAVVDFVIDLARRSQHRIMVRLVKGAYWDSEIKRAQVDGLEDFPVFTRKVHSDIAYLACARKLLAAPDAVYPQFATHNAHTLAAIYQMAGPEFRIGQYEFQCLHGMGEPLYEQVVARDAGGLARPCRIYAPVGTHETLLAYLVRRLLENGSNSSFVNRIANEAVSIDELVADPVAIVEQQARVDGVLGLPHPAIALPPRLFGAARRNSLGLDLANEQQLALLTAALQASAARSWRAEPMLAVPPGEGNRSETAITNPADRRDRVGVVIEANAADIDAAMAAAVAGAARWSHVPAAERAAVLERAADALEAQMPSLLGLIVREAGKTCANSVGEVREAVDFLRYYAAQARAELAGAGPAATGAGRLHQSVEFSARDLHRTGGRGARGRQQRACEARRADAADRGPGRGAAACGRRARGRAAVPSRPRRGGWRPSCRRCSRARRDVHRINRRRTTAATQPGRAARRTRAADSADRRNRRAERDVRRFLCPAGAGRRGRDGVGVRQRRAAVLRAARALRPGRYRRPHRANARGRDARMAGRHAGPAGDRHGARDRRGGASEHRGPYRGDARAEPARVPTAGADRPAAAARQLRCADADRDRLDRRAEARGVRAGPAPASLPAQPRSRNLSMRSTRPDTA